MSLGRSESPYGNPGDEHVNPTSVEEKLVEEAEDTGLAAAFEDDSSDGSDCDNGLVRWCGSQEFSNGGARSHQDCLRSESPVQQGESGLGTSLAMVDSRGAKRFAAVSVLLETVKTGPEVEENLGVRKRG